PDDALVRVRITRRHQQEHAERRIEAHDHRQVVGVALPPGPAGGPDDAQRIEAEYESEADDDQRDAKVKRTTGCRHCAPRASDVPRRWTIGRIPDRCPLRNRRAGLSRMLGDVRIRLAKRTTLARSEPSVADPSRTYVPASCCDARACLLYYQVISL